MSRLRGLALLLLALGLASCAQQWQRAARDSEPATAATDSLGGAVILDSEMEDGLRAVRWHLHRAHEAQLSQSFDLAQQDLDLVFQLLAALEEADSDDPRAQAELESLSAAAERAYMDLLPNLERFSADSPLTLLLRGLSKEQLEGPDAENQRAQIDKLLHACDVPIDINDRVISSIRFFQTRGRTTYTTWLRRAGRYDDLIRQTFREEGLPEDLLFVSMIESGFNPHARSKAHAVGLWQFIESTGKMEGLNSTRWVDERRDPVKSTRAAARHLKRLHQELGDWRLALAAYNAGPGRVARAIERAGTRDYWKLDLPEETRNYVPLFMAAALLSKDPKLFGFDPENPEPDLSFAEVEVPHPVFLEEAARCMRISHDTLQDLNPELRLNVTPPQSALSYRLRVPPGTDQDLRACFAQLPEAWQQYVVKRRDTISTIARAFGISTQVIAQVNHLKNPNRIAPGQTLTIPVGAAGSLKSSLRVAHVADGSPIAGEGAKAAARAGKTVYKVRRGDSLSRIAQLHGVEIGDLRRWNRLRGNHIVAGDKLTIWSSMPGSGLRAGTALPTAEAKRRDYTVRRGESLWDISRKFKVPVADLKRWNKLDNTAIRPGQHLVVAPGTAAPAKGVAAAGGKKAASTKMASATGKKVAPAKKKSGSSVQVYTVVRGDTLLGIARKFGLEVRELAHQNNLSPSAKLAAGMTLKVKPATKVR
ncbi:MAG: LysM peptidoglycan-binding domain-containing protein [Candidatus Latescibacteria bacterium]|nr:LysM peptidoglycan-binding domain-containing protein [Candidatus Latescibacterota bacterium]